MKLKKKIYYWSPFLVRIATPKAVINSAYAMQKFSNVNQCSLINFFTEFDIFKKELIQKELKTINCYNSSILKFLPKHGKILSRFSFILIFILSFFPLKKLISKERPDYLIIHLITSLPLFLLLIFNFETKFILRISGMPRMGIIRKFLWKLVSKKIHLITCPSNNTMAFIKSLNIIDSNKIKLLYDPILEIKDINLKKKEKISEKKDFFLAVGRLTKQKNFVFLCRAFKEILKESKQNKLIIVGDGEESKKIKDYINKNNLNEYIELKGFEKNIFPYFFKAKGFILSSLWEDPGFVLIEAGYCRVPIFSSNCKPGPEELIKDDFNGTVFESNSMISFKVKFKEFLNNYKNTNLILNNLKNIKKFTIFNHYLSLKKILES